MNMWTAIADERRRLADDLASLRPHDWTRPTVCHPWDVKAVGAHLILPFEVSKPRFALHVIRNKRDIPKTIIQLSAKVNAARTTDQIVASLRSNADSKWKPPGTGPDVPLGEIVVHGQDIRRAVGIKSVVAADIVTTLLDAIGDPTIRADYAERISFADANANGGAK